MQRFFDANQVVIKFNINPLESATELNYLGNTIRYNNSDSVALYSNLKKSHRRYGMVAKVVGKMGKPIKACEIRYKLVVHAMLLYGSKIWALTDAIMKFIEGFSHRIARPIGHIRKTLKRN